MRYVLGIDGGGTSTCAVIVDAEGRLQGVGWSGSANYDDVGVEGTQRHLGGAVQAARAEAGLPATPFDAAFLGLAGVVSETDRSVIRSIAQALDLAEPDRVGIDHDCRVALAGGLSGRPGIVQIAGTGSSCYGRTADGRAWRAGGWGHLISDEGSSYWLGREAMRRAVQAYDGRAPHTTLLDAVMTHLALEDVNDLMHRLYVEGMARAEVAALAPLVVQAATAGDAAAQALLDDGAAHLADCIEAVARRLGFDDRTCPVVLVGGLFRAGAAIRDPLRRHVEARLPHADLHDPELPPALGAALLALHHLGVAVTPSVRHALADGVERVVSG
jgi:N-acetylglucosamine kinase-like BadF-type ATPase